MKRLYSTSIVILLFTLLIDSTNTYAQTYADGQASGVTGICLFCGTTTAGRASDGDPDTYSTMVATVGALGYVYQRLSFPTDGFPGNYVSVVVENPIGLIDVSLLAGFSITTYNNGVSNHDTQGAGSLLFLSLLGQGNKFVIQFQPTSNFDAVEIRLGGVLNVLSSMRIYYATISDVPLPVKFQYFSASKVQDAVQLNWAFEDHSEIGYNIIQKSSDGSEFYNLDTIHSGETNAFIYNDASLNALPNQYYRILFKNNLGEESYSDIVVVVFDSERIMAYPNPFTDNLNIIKGNSVNESISLIITNAEGRQVYNNQVSFTDYYQLNELSNLEEGIYSLQIISDHKISNSTIIKR